MQQEQSVTATVTKKDIKNRQNYRLTKSYCKHNWQTDIGIIRWMDGQWHNIIHPILRWAYDNWLSMVMLNSNLPYVTIPHIKRYQADISNHDKRCKSDHIATQKGKKQTWTRYVDSTPMSDHYPVHPPHHDHTKVNVTVMNGRLTSLSYHNHHPFHSWEKAI